jgi:MHS family alpha-ketoglutarate permease-like MFS transporter
MSAATLTLPATYAPAAPAVGRRVIWSALLSNLVQWYDWYAFPAFSLYFSGAFFPTDDAAAQLLYTAGIFALGFLMRPLGSWLFGRLADKLGRRQALSLSGLLMGLGSLLLALTPTYQTVGLVAPAMLLTARLLQGLSVGGEYGVGTAYLAEVAGRPRRAFYTSFLYTTLIAAQLLALGAQLVLQRVLAPAQLLDWGWRLPFVGGAALAGLALYLRARLPETAPFETDSARQPEERRGSLRALAQHPRAVLLVVGLTLGGTLAFYTFTTYMQKFLVNTTGLPLPVATAVCFGSLLVFAALQPLYGALADRVGRRPLLLFFGVVGTLGTVPLLTALAHAPGPWAALGLLLLAFVVLSGYSAINALVKAELFPVEIRALGIGLPHALTVALFGGTAEYFALWWKQAGHESYFYWYLAACIGTSLLLLLLLPETRRNSCLDGDGC